MGLGPCRTLTVAPMMDRTDRHFRLLMRLLAPHAWLYTEMITATALVRGDARRLLKFDPREHPVAVQLGGNDPDELVDAARRAVDFGYDEVNLNVGCPSSRVQAGRFGVALMRDGERVGECIAAMIAAVDVPVTVKTRLGVDHDDSYEFLAAFTREMVAAGCRTLIVHARKAWLKGLSPKQNRDVPPLDYGRVHQLKAEFADIEILINGGFKTVEDAVRELEFVDGVMLGRAAYDDPMLVAQLDRQIFAGQDELDLDAALDAFLDYVEAELELGTPLKSMTRHLMGFFAHQPGARRWRRGLSLLDDGPAGLVELRAQVEAMNTHGFDSGPAQSPLYRHHLSLYNSDSADP